LDFSARLENLEAGIIDLWAVNVLSAIASKGSGEQSQINCAVGRWTMNNGILRSDVFVIDTSKIRICANGQVDFKKKRIDLKAAPTPKRPEFFSLATPLQVQGSFTDFGMGVQPGGLFGTAINVVTSPIITPIRKLAGEGLPADGADVCGLAIGPDNRSTTPPAGCK
jgi:uncharacterized protein involved in outer membrane biogenesis